MRQWDAGGWKMYFKNDFFRSASYRRLHAVATVLERFVASAPKALCIGQLSNEIDMTPAEIKKICANLSGMGLIAGTDSDHWALVGAPGDITLEDVWRSVMADQRAPRKPVLADEPAGDIDLLIAQALLAINQSISTQLRKCQLDRVKASHCGFWVALD